VLAFQYRPESFILKALPTRIFLPLESEDILEFVPDTVASGVDTRRPPENSLDLPQGFVFNRCNPTTATRLSIIPKKEVVHDQG